MAAEVPTITDLYPPQPTDPKGQVTIETERLPAQWRRIDVEVVGRALERFEKTPDLSGSSFVRIRQSFN